MKKRVVITGVGLVTPLGTGVEKTWSALLAGTSGIGQITRFDTTGFKTTIAGEVKDFVATDHLTVKEAKRSQPFITYAVAAARMALEASGLVVDDDNRDHIGVITGCGLGGLSMLENTAETIRTRGPRRVTPFFIPLMIGNMAPGMISIQLGVRGPNASIATACAAGTHAVGEAYHLVQSGRARAMITGGVESVITPTCIAGFNAMKALSTRNDNPAAASRPFDAGRDGFVVGEGGGMLVIESLEDALERGASILAEIAGHGMSGDGYHMTAPSPDGNGAARCMQAALDDAGMTRDDIDYINAHGTATPMNDELETIAIKSVFGDKAHSIAVSSTKSMTGHLLGGAGGVETVFTAMAISEGCIPPTVNLENPSPGCDLDYVPIRARKMQVRAAMSNSFGFGGTNAAVILRRCDHP